MYAFCDGLNSGHGAKRFHCVIDMPVNATLRNIEDLADFERTLPGSAPGEAFQLPLSKNSIAVVVFQIMNTLYGRECQK